MKNPKVEMAEFKEHYKVIKAINHPAAVAFRRAYYLSLKPVEVRREIYSRQQLIEATRNFLSILRELHVSDVLNALVEMTDGVLWKQPEADGHVTRFTALLNEKWKAAAVRALPVSEEKP